MTSEMRLKSVFLADVKVSLEEPKDPHLSMYMLNAGPRPSTYIWGGLGEGEGWIHIFFMITHALKLQNAAPWATARHLRAALSITQAQSAARTHQCPQGRFPERQQAAQQRDQTESAL